MEPQGGATAQVPEGASPLGWRDAKWSIHYLGMWAKSGENEAQIDWIRDVASAMKPWAQEGTYLNYLGDEGDDRVRASFGAHFQRMQG